MTKKFHGGCACGAIKFEASAAPVLMLNCHCRHCQRATGSAYAAIAAFDKANVSLSGEPKYYTSTGLSGGLVDRGFCDACGNPVTIRLHRMADVLGIHAATFDDPAMFSPAIDLFTASAQGWDTMHPDRPKRPGGPQT